MCNLMMLERVTFKANPYVGQTSQRIANGLDQDRVHRTSEGSAADPGGIGSGRALLDGICRILGDTGDDSHEVRLRNQSGSEAMVAVLRPSVGRGGLNHWSAWVGMGRLLAASPPLGLSKAVLPNQTSKCILSRSFPIASFAMNPLYWTLW